MASTPGSDADPRNLIPRRILPIRMIYEQMPTLIVSADEFGNMYANVWPDNLPQYLEMNLMSIWPTTFVTDAQHVVQAEFARGQISLMVHNEYMQICTFLNNPRPRNGFKVGCDRFPYPRILLLYTETYLPEHDKPLYDLLNAMNQMLG